jgi:hypothetical protein
MNSKNTDSEAAPTASPIIMMHEPSEEAEASIPTENVRDAPNLNPSFTVSRKAAKRTFPWDLPAEGLNLLSPLQAKDSPAAKKPRLEEPFSAPADEAATSFFFTRNHCNRFCCC